MSLVPTLNPPQGEVNTLVVRILPLTRQLSAKGLLDESERADLKELAFARDPDLQFLLQEGETNLAPPEDVAESLVCFVRARRSADSRLRHHLQQTGPHLHRRHTLRDFVLFHWENFTSVLWFRLWDALLVRLIAFVCQRFPAVAWMLSWLIRDPD